jgi:hypothetical protein
MFRIGLGECAIIILLVLIVFAGIAVVVRLSRR